MNRTMQDQLAAMEIARLQSRLTALESAFALAVHRLEKEIDDLKAIVARQDNPRQRGLLRLQEQHP